MPTRESWIGYDTKRYAFDAVSEWINTIETQRQVSPSRNGCLAILGVRKAGKSVLLQQLYELAPENSVYADIRNLDFDTAQKIKDWFAQWDITSITRIYLDEVCKIPDSLRNTFCSCIQGYANRKVIVITGSTKYGVRKISNEIGSGTIFDLCPILYSERLLWGSSSEGTQQSLRDLSSVDKYRLYLHYNEIFADKTGLTYIASVLSDTLNSCLHNFKNAENASLKRIVSEISNDSSKLSNLLTYVSLAQHIFVMPSSGQIVSIPNLNKPDINLSKELSNLYDILASRQGIKKADIVAFCKLLREAGLARDAYNSTDSQKTLDVVNKCLGIASSPAHKRLEALTRLDSETPSMLFEFPQFSSYVFQDSLCNNIDVESKWVEDSILLKAAYCYSFVDKYRSSTGDTELDVLYTSLMGMSDVFAIEVKNRPMSNLNRDQLFGYARKATELGISELVLTATDVNAFVRNYEGYLPINFYRVDLLYLALEQEYVSLSHDYLLGKIDIPYTKLRISELMQKYGLDEKIEQ